MRCLAAPRGRSRRVRVRRTDQRSVRCRSLPPRAALTHPPRAPARGRARAPAATAETDDAGAAPATRGHRCASTALAAPSSNAPTSPHRCGKGAAQSAALEGGTFKAAALAALLTAFDALAAWHTFQGWGFRANGNACRPRALSRPNLPSINPKIVLISATCLLHSDAPLKTTLLVHPPPPSRAALGLFRRALRGVAGSSFSS